MHANPGISFNSKIFLCEQKPFGRLNNSPRINYTRTQVLPGFLPWLLYSIFRVPLLLYKNKYSIFRVLLLGRRDFTICRVFRDIVLPAANKKFYYFILTGCMFTILSFRTEVYLSQSACLSLYLSKGGGSRVKLRGESPREIKKGRCSLPKELTRTSQENLEWLKWS